MAISNTLEERVARVEGTLEQINIRLNSLENRLDRVEDSLADLRREITANFRWTIGTIIIMWVTIIIAILVT